MHDSRCNERLQTPETELGTTDVEIDFTLQVHALSVVRWLQLEYGAGEREVCLQPKGILHAAVVPHLTLIGRRVCP